MTFKPVLQTMIAAREGEMRTESLVVFLPHRNKKEKSKGKQGDPPQEIQLLYHTALNMGYEAEYVRIATEGTTLRITQEK